MIKFALGLVGVLLLAACSFAPTQTASTPAGAAQSGGAGHPDPSYPGPRAY
jgi:hypothetical protein